MFFNKQKVSHKDLKRLEEIGYNEHNALETKRGKIELQKMILKELKTNNLFQLYHETDMTSEKLIEALTDLGKIKEGQYII